MILATDLDGTFLGGDDTQRKILYKLIRETENIQLIFVSGRGVESIEPLFDDELIPRPDFIIADVGATIVYGDTLKAVEPIQQEIEAAWPGQEKVMSAVKAFKGLRLQTVPQTRRCSFFLDDISILPKLHEVTDQLGCDTIYSAGKFLDIIARGTNKGTTLEKLAAQLKQNPGEILVAGDTMNDMSMYRMGFKGVVVGNAEPELVLNTGQIENVYHAAADGAGGIHESLKYFRFI